MSALIGSLERDIPWTPRAYGWPPVLDALAHRYGVTSDAIALAAGATGANTIVMATLLEPGDHVLVETPAYDPLYRIPETFGATISFVERSAASGYALDVDAFRAALTPKTRLIVLTNLHNPTGVRASDAALRALADLAASVGAYVLVDEVYLEWLRDDTTVSEPVHAAAMLSPHIITTSSPSKAFGFGGLQIGWAIAAPALITRFRRTALLLGVNPSHLVEHLMERALRDVDAIIAPMRARMMQHRALVHAWVARMSGAHWHEPAAGTTAFVNLGRGDTRALVARLIQDFDTAVVPGHFFGAPEYVRIGMGVETEILTTGLERVSAAMEGPLDR